MDCACDAVCDQRPWNAIYVSLGLMGYVQDNISANGAYVPCGRCVMTQQLRHLSTCVQTLAIWKVSWHLFLGALPFKLVNDAATFVGPIFLNLLLGVVSAGKSSTLGYSYAALMFVGLVIGTLCDNQHFQRVMRAGTLQTLPMLSIIF